MRSLRIAHLVSYLSIGGTERVIFDLCLHGAERQKVVSTVDGPMRTVLEQHGVEVQVGDDRAQLVSCLSDVDVVNVHWQGYQPSLFDIVIAAGRPMVCTVHAQSRLPEMPGLVICTSQHVYDRQEFNRDRRVLITNGIDMTDIPPTARRSGHTEIIRVCRPVKCAEYFWPAVFQVLAACPEAELTVVGGPAYQAGRIESLGYRLDVVQLMARADLFAYTPTPTAGSFDLVVLEAMASGLPCVMSDVPCVNEAVEHEVTGLLTPFEDVSAFVTCLQRLVRDRELREAMGQRAAEVARQRFEVRDRMPLYSAAYDRAASEAILPSERPMWRQKYLEWLINIQFL